MQKSEIVQPQENEEASGQETLVSKNDITKNPPQEKTLRKIRQELQIKFVGCFVLGAVLIPVYPEIFYGLLPLVAMILYFILGYPSMKITAAKPVFADSFYYLGFLFTFAALLIAITVKGSDITL